MMATGSADEMQVWTLSATSVTMWRSTGGEDREIARMLQGLSRTASDT